MFKRLGGALLLSLVAACAQPPPRPPPPMSPAPAHPTAPGTYLLPSRGVYRIDPTRSELRVLVYRAGPLARLGHNHVIVNHALRGEVHVAADLSDSSVSIDVPALDFIVDDAGTRQEEGADFPTDVPEDARSGTLHNLLSAAVLDAGAFPDITATSTALAASQGTLIATLTVKVAGRESVIDAPLTLQSDAAGLTATGSLELRQTAVGLTPYSLMLGALQVQDAVRIKFTITAAIG